MLTQLQTGELSLVRRGANNKRIAITKSEEDMTFDELLKSVLETEAEGESELLKTLKASGADADALEVAKANYRMQHGFKDKLSVEQLGEVAKAAGYVVKEEDDDDDEDKDKPAFLRGKKKKKDKAKKSHVPADMPPEMAAIFKTQQDEMADLRKSNDEQGNELSVMKKETLRKEYVQKCATEFPFVPGMNPDQMGEMLQKAYEVGDEFGKQLEGQWKSTSEAIKDSSLMDTHGRLVINGGSGGAPTDKLNTIAKGIAEKKKISFAKAYTEAMDENPELYQEYLSDNPAQTGRRY